MEEKEKKEKKRKKGCELKDQTIADGTELCVGDVCMTCEDGDWIEEARDTGC